MAAVMTALRVMALANAVVVAVTMTAAGTAEARGASAC
jgi:hypothetical protein